MVSGIIYSEQFFQRHKPSLTFRPFALLSSLVFLLSLTGCLETKSPIPETQPEFKLGTDRLFEEAYISLIRGKRVGLISNHTGVNSALIHTSDLLESAREVKLVVLFGPEHGFSGSFQAGEIIENGPKVFSLYGEHRAPTDQMLAEVDVLIYDIQDVGARFYTYISTLFESMKIAAQKQIPFVVLDRPNPLGGLRVDGPVIGEDYFSFVGIFSIPIRYGMTVGELAHFFNSEANIHADLTVVPMSGWNRKDRYPIDKLQWISPSPNMPAIRTAEMYPGFCLIEGTNLSEGRGTTLPFELVGSPWLDTENLVKKLNDQKIPGAFFRSQRFTPTFSKYQGENCSGIQIHIIDHQLFEPIYSALSLISEVLKRHPDELEFRRSDFDRLIGNSWVREWLQEGRSVGSIAAEWEKGTEEFRRKSQRYYWY